MARDIGDPVGPAGAVEFDELGGLGELADLGKSSESAASAGLAAAIRLAGAARRLCVLTGAGISTDSGIPDFRGPSGVWTRDPSGPRYLDFRAYMNDPDVRAESWRRRALHPAFAAEPNAAHRALAQLHALGRLPVVLTQNIDGLHQRGGVPRESVIELHGTLYETECLGCPDRRPMDEALARVRGGETDPPCRQCGGVLKSATVFFGQPLDPVALKRAALAVRDCDLFLAIGTTLAVQPVAGLVPMAHRAGIPVVIINAQPTPYDDLAQAVVREPIGQALPALVRHIGGPATRVSSTTESDGS
jgi:NAD-dependent deacetylase